MTIAEIKHVLSAVGDCGSGHGVSVPQNDLRGLCELANAADAYCRSRMYADLMRAQFNTGKCSEPVFEDAKAREESYCVRLLNAVIGLRASGAFDLDSCSHCSIPIDKDWSRTHDGLCSVCYIRAKETVTVPCTCPSCRGIKVSGAGFPAQCVKGQETHAICNECLGK